MSQCIPTGSTLAPPALINFSSSSSSWTLFGHLSLPKLRTSSRLASSRGPSSTETPLGALAVSISLPASKSRLVLVLLLLLLCHALLCRPGQIVRPNSIRFQPQTNPSINHQYPNAKFRFFARANQTRTLSLESKLNICQQVTNAMTYLHDKDIVHGKLTSVNIYIETNRRVKISLIDNDEQQLASTICANQSSCSPSSQHDTRLRGGNEIRATNSAKVSFNLPALTYLSPEIVRTISISDETGHNHGRRTAQVHLDTEKLTKKSDVFSFGTLLFELFEDHFPFAKANHCDRMSLVDLASAISPTSQIRHSEAAHSLLFTASPLSTFSQHRQQSPFETMTKTGWNGNIKASASELIFQIGSGQMNSRNKLRKHCPALVDQIIRACWTYEPNRRPNFKQMSFENIGEQFKVIYDELNE